MTVLSGAASAESMPCTQPHTWETFAIALMAATAQTFDQPTLTANPTVSKVCSRAVLLRSRQVQTLRLPAGIWLAKVLPPSEASFDTGRRTYRCVAEELERQPSSSQFTR